MFAANNYGTTKYNVIKIDRNTYCTVHLRSDNDMPASFELSVGGYLRDCNFRIRYEHCVPPYARPHTVQRFCNLRL